MLTIRRLRAHLPAGTQPVAARLALQTLAAGLESACPASLPPQALLWVRRLRLQLPAQVLQRPAPGLQAGLAASRDQLGSALQLAQRPAKGAVADGAEAVLFADAAELLAALALAAAGGELDRWWWRGLLGQAWPDWTRAWAARPEAGAAAHRLLARQGWRLVVGGDGGPVLVASAVDAAAPAAAEGLASAPAAPAGPAPEGPLPLDDAGPGLPGRRLAGPTGPPVAGTDRGTAWSTRPPGAAGDRPAATAADGVAPLRAEPAAEPTLPAGADDRATPLHGSPVQPGPGRGARRASVAGSSPSILPDQREAPLPRADQAAAGGGVPARPPDDAPTRPTGPLAGPPGGRAGPAGRPAAAAALPAVPPQTGPAEPAPVPRPAAPGKAVPASAPAPARAMPGPTPRAPPGPPPGAPPALPTDRTTDLPTDWPWPQALATHQAPLLFVVNLLLEEGHYPDFTRPLDRGLAVPLWALLPALARAWRLPPDPLTVALRARAGAWTPAPGFEAWLRVFSVALRRRLCRRLGWRVGHLAAGLVLPAPARVWLSEAEVVAQFDLGSHDVAWRLGGLDRDPGWLPSAACSLRFEFS